VEFQIPCKCGKSLFVTEGMAGASIRCRCGRAVLLPSLREMKSRYAAVPDVHLAEPEAHPAAPVVLGVFVCLLYGVPALVGALALLAAGLPLACLGFLVAAMGQICLVALIMRHCPPRAAAYTLIVPFFTTVFAIQRWDVAKWPFVIRTAGIVVTVAALCAGG